MLFVLTKLGVANSLFSSVAKSSKENSLSETYPFHLKQQKVLKYANSHEA